MAGKFSLLYTIVDFIKSLFGGRAKPSKDTSCVVVGMERSSKYGKCPGAKNDSNRMASLLAKHGKVRLLQDAQANTAMFRDALEEACKKELCILHYSGHGGLQGSHEFLCLNNGPFWDHQIWDIVSKAKGRVVLIFDCCHSGHMYRSSGIDDLPEDRDIDIRHGFEFKLLMGPIVLSGNNILVWSGCPKESFSYGDESGGVLTNGILSAYSPSKSYDKVWTEARRRAASQNPVRTILGSGFGGKVFR